MWRHRSVSLNNEKICCEISEDKIAFCEKTAGLQHGKFSDSNSACSKVLVPVKIFQFQNMLKGHWQRKFLLAISILLDNRTMKILSFPS